MLFCLSYPMAVLLPKIFFTIAVHLCYNNMDSMLRRGDGMGGGKTVLITGASTGIGRALAEQFAQNGFALLLTARNPNTLAQAAERLTAAYGVEVHAFPMDLSRAGAAEALYRRITAEGHCVDILVNNAGAGACGLFHELPLQGDADMAELNMMALTVLTKLFARDMIARGGGKILNVASTGAYQPGPYIAVYYATKAYVLSLSQALTDELAPFGISVSALCPGATKTEFSRRAGKLDMRGAMTPDYVASCAYRGLMRGKRVIIPSLAMKLGVAASKILPGRVSAYIVGKAQKRLAQGYRRQQKQQQ